MRCADCPVAAEAECLGDTHPEAFAFFCQRWARGNERERETIAMRSALGFAPAPPRSAPDPPPAVTPALPLAGDLVELAARRLGAKRLAEWVSAKLGTDCGCERRRLKLNDLDRTLRRYLGG